MIDREIIDRLRVPPGKEVGGELVSG